MYSTGRAKHTAGPGRRSSPFVLLLIKTALNIQQPSIFYTLFFWLRVDRAETLDIPFNFVDLSIIKCLVNGFWSRALKLLESITNAVFRFDSPSLRKLEQPWVIDKAAADVSIGGNGYASRQG